MKNKHMPARLIALCLAVLFALSISVCASASVPSRPENKYVLDSAGVLSESTEQTIISENQSLFKESGGEIVIVAVDFLGGEDIADYTYDLFNSWGIGSSERNNGILLVLAIGEDNYYAQAGYGIEEHFDGALMQSLVDDYLEDDFAAGDYDAGVRKFFNAALAEMKAYEYNDEYESASYSPGGAYENYGGYDVDLGGIGLTSVIFTVVKFMIKIVLIVVIVIVLIAIIRALNSGGNGGTGTGGGGGFWTGMFIGSRMNRRRGWHNPPPPPGGFGGPVPRPGPRPGVGTPRPPRGGFGGPSRPMGGSHGGFSGGGHSSRTSGGGRSGGFSGGGGSRGGGAGRR